MIEIRGIKVPIDKNIEKLEAQIMKKLRLKQVPEYIILKRSIDARKKSDIHYVYQVGVFLPDENRIVKKVNDNNVMLTERVEYEFPSTGSKKLSHRPLVVGSGPAGLFCALILARMGYRPIVVERGLPVEERVQKVQDFFDGKPLDTECNVQFGEGGAGTFSDGKLNTQVKDKYGRIRFVLEEFVKYGAPEEILYDNKPHVGTDLLIQIVKGIREEIEALGGTILFHKKVTDIRVEKHQITAVRLCDSRPEDLMNCKQKNLKNCSQEDLTIHKQEKLTDSTQADQIYDNHDFWIECKQVVFAIGHSARDTFDILYNKQLSMEAKDFAMGVRIEHPAGMIQKAMYGTGTEAKLLPAAPYKVTHQSENGRGVYSFCMCPGGYVVNASSEEGHTAVNGMSYSGRNGENSNSALVVTVRRSDFESEHPLAGIAFQRQLERNIYKEGQGKIVVQRFGDFEKHVPSENLGHITPQMKGAYVLGNVADCLPDFMTDAIIEGIYSFEKSIPGFSDKDAVLSGVESRTSSPVRIHRDETFQANVRGIYPCGEGAGYAGGIMSAAMDGMKVAEAIIKEFAPFEV